VATASTSAGGRRGVTDACTWMERPRIERRL
jgi:hypothetical protein